MIGKQDILDRAHEWQLRPDVVEKDYVLGWVLAAIAQHPETSEHWVFKGGTCLKKCYFETYRFSEDLDFTLLPEAMYEAHALTQALREVTEIAHELSGINFPGDVISVRARTDKLGRETFEGKIGYRGPLDIPSTPRLLFDLTLHEPVLAEPELRPIFHAYPDSLPQGTAVQAYSLEELFAEKTRALFERTRPRDLYDVVFLVISHADDVNYDDARDFFCRKCEAKGFKPPSSDELLVVVRSSAELRSEWGNMLAHQLPQLPPFEGHLTRLTRILQWIDAPPPGAAPAMATYAATGEIIAPAGVTYWGLGVPLEAARFAGINRLLVEFTYKAKSRQAEPYSLRRSKDGNLLLYAWEVGSTNIKAFSVSRIVDLRVSSTTFAPRYPIEFSPVGGIAAPMLVRTSHGVRTMPAQSRRARSRSRRIYIFRCGYCQKLFRHSTNDPTLRAHKTSDGGRCSSRRGYLERTE
jgi:predicted nucleotidyltransferase component of viral defense system